jgi:hypothetical protein
MKRLDIHVARNIECHVGSAHYFDLSKADRQIMVI